MLIQSCSTAAISKSPSATGFNFREATMDNKKPFIGYEYKNIQAARDLGSIYLDSYPNFGWELEGGVSSVPYAAGAVSSLKFKRDRNIKNRVQLAKLERQFEEHVRVIENLEKSKAANASIAAFTIGIIGAAFMAGAVLAYQAGMLPLMVILAIPGFLGWVFPYFCYRGMIARRTAKVSPLIDEQYDALYDVCEKAHALLAA
jgi:hypothetical protein